VPRGPKGVRSVILSIVARFSRNAMTDIPGPNCLPIYPDLALKPNLGDKRR
jgi:hypothetical protein